MSVQRLPSGRWRAQVWHEGRNVSVTAVLTEDELREFDGERGTFPNKTAAKRAREEARRALRRREREERERAQEGETLREFWERWTTDPLFARPKESTNVHNRERTKAFVERYGSMPMRAVGAEQVAEWLAGGQRNGQVPALRVMWNDARKTKAGRVVDANPWEKLGLASTRGNRDETPASEEQVECILAAARKVAPLSFAAWLEVACFIGARPGELDALRWECVDFAADRVLIREQWNAKARGFTAPKNGEEREAPLTPRAREALLRLPRENAFCFKPLYAEHYTPSSRAYWWKAVKALAGWDKTLYLATRHFAGSYMTNVLELPSEDVAIALGHTDGGELVRLLYGHRDRQRALDRVQQAYEQAGKVVPLRVVREGEAS